ncbi:MAG: GIY-YIG nuclease family protein [Pseudomonadota bacterium]
MPYFVYILGSRPGGALYVGMTNDLRKRVAQHRARSVKGHTARYNVHTLYWFEMHDTLEAALRREKAIKRWHRAWKIDLIRRTNPTWRDVASDIPL